MFTGIVEEQGVVQRFVTQKNLGRLAVCVRKALPAKVGDSVAVNGVCLTVSAKRQKTLQFDVMKETLQCTTLGDIRAGEKVNLERAMKFGSRFDGHFVTGHIDGVGTIKKKITQARYVEFTITAARKLLRYIVPKGSVCLDGISLTVGRVTKDGFSVYLIPHTLKVTTFGKKRTSDPVNIETDILAKYILSR